MLLPELHQQLLLPEVFCLFQEDQLEVHLLEVVHPVGCIDLDREDMIQSHVIRFLLHRPKDFEYCL